MSFWKNGIKVPEQKWEVWANVPDQDHVRGWFKVGECTTLKEYDEIREAYIASWRGTSNVMRLREPGSFELRKAA